MLETLELPLPGKDGDASGVANTNAAPKEPGTRDMYADEGMLYNYDFYPKTDASLNSYFSLPVVRDFFTKLHEMAQSKPRTLLDLGSGVGVESKFIKESQPNVSVISLELSDYGSKKLNKSRTRHKYKPRHWKSP